MEWLKTTVGIHDREMYLQSSGCLSHHPMTLMEINYLMMAFRTFKDVHYKFESKHCSFNKLSDGLGNFAVVLKVKPNLKDYSSGRIKEKQGELTVFSNSPEFILGTREMEKLRKKLNDPVDYLLSWPGKRILGLRHKYGNISVVKENKQALMVKSVQVVRQVNDLESINALHTALSNEMFQVACNICKAIKGKSSDFPKEVGIALIILSNYMRMGVNFVMSCAETDAVVEGLTKNLPESKEKGTRQDLNDIVQLTVDKWPETKDMVDKVDHSINLNINITQISFNLHNNRA